MYNRTMQKARCDYLLPVSIIREGDSFVAYSPALDLSTVGETFEKAQKMFDEAVQIFFEETIEKGTLEEVLLELGWQKKDKTLTPPMVISNQTATFSVPCYN